MELSVIIPAHNPDPERLRRALGGLREQSLARSLWEVLIVDNASTRFPGLDFFAEHAPPGLRVVREMSLGLTRARIRGFGEARGDVVVLVDDDNVLERDYLANVLRHFAELPRLGAMGGISAPEFEKEPEGWQHEFMGLLALRDLGPAPRIAETLRPPGSARNEYPAFAPVGAGMALRREAASRWAASATQSPISDRRGGELSSAGDNDIVLTIMEQGWQVAYFPDLRLTHLIPAARLDPEYLARLNRGIQKSWMQALARHDANAWPPLTAAGAALRKARAWFAYRAWSSPAAQVRWSGACGHFEGRVRPPHR